jgi:cellulose synthase/poly-beta-1,6-N-acetylglucosamine synthase-like glycosyltransferase
MQKPEGQVEIFYIDSDSSDDSVERARNLGVKTIELKPLRPCAAIARNAGWKAAAAPTILFLDGDTELASDFVVKSIGEFNDPRIAVVYGHRREIEPQLSVFTRVLDLDWMHPPGPSAFCGGDALVRRSALEEAGGFDESLIAGEEPELCRRMRSRGWVVLHHDVDMVKHHLGVTSPAQYWRRAIRSGYAYAEVSARFRDTSAPLWKYESKHNWLAGLAILSLLIGAVAFSIGLGSGLPILIALLILVALSIRTAVRNRWKTSDWVTLLLYGMHSHLQQIPILFGQVKYRWRRSGVVQRLIEYKRPGNASEPRVAPAKRPSSRA